ncbi:MAG: NAD-dependent epimerase/dehydratase family protein [Clostridium sp.]|jgi:nucleoside-diphosphate-sugar epimerase|nr:NAD-dependent epimerase/dehydratase family protein [Clostridium sp.]
MPKAEIIKEDVAQIRMADLPWRRFYGKTILISGANGYVPAYFVHTFLELNDSKNAGCKIIALCRSEDRARERFAEYWGRDDFVLHIQDVCKPIGIGENVSYFIHAASPAGIRSRHADPAATFSANVTGCENMLKLAATNHCEGFLFVSSVDIYGRMPNGERLTESRQGSLDTLNVRNAYSCGKRAAETLCAVYCAKYGLPIVVARPFQIFGPGIALDDGRLHIDFVSQLLSGDQIVLKSDGSAVRSFLYITDAITGMLSVLLNGIPGQAYNIVDENGEASVLELARRMADLSIGRNIEVVFDDAARSASGAFPCVTGSSEKLRRLGWLPSLSLNDGAKRMMKYYGLDVSEEGGISPC